MAGDELKMLTELHFSVIRAIRSPSRTISKQVVPVKDIPNLFHDWKVLNELSDEEMIRKLSLIPNINIFMVVELYNYEELRSVLDKVLRNITQIVAPRCRAPSRFIQSFVHPEV